MYFFPHHPAGLLLQDRKEASRNSQLIECGRSLKSKAFKAQKSSSEQREVKQHLFAQTPDFKFSDECSVN